MISSRVMRIWAELGLSLDDVIRVVEAMEQDIAQSHRNANAERQRRYRERQRERLGDDDHTADNAHNVTSNASPSLPPSLPLPLKERSPPTPPSKENNPLSLPTSLPPRIPPARDFASSDDFDAVFWPSYPHKVGKPHARRAFDKAIKRDSLQRIMDGLRRYVETKPSDRPWLNPSTFLNQDRWNDEPASDHTAKPSGHDALFAALANQASEGCRRSARDSDVDGWHRGYGSPAWGDQGDFLDLAAEADPDAGRSEDDCV